MCCSNDGYTRPGVEGSEGPLVGVVILHFRNVDDTISCVASLRRQSYENRRLYVVDNDCSGAIAGYLPEEVQVLLPSENEGYARGNNLGTRAAVKDGCEFILIVNNDVVFIDPETLSTLVQAIVSDRRIGILGPRIILPNGREQKPVLQRPSLFDYCGGYYLKGALRRLSRRGTLGNGGIVEIYAVSGCCFIARVDLCDREGNLFDPATFLYAEEKILSERAMLKGFGVYHTRQVSILHLGSRAGDALSLRQYLARIRSEFYYLKEYRRFSVLALILAVGGLGVDFLIAHCRRLASSVFARSRWSVCRR